MVDTFANAATPLVTPTYDGSGQAVEPSVVHFPGGWQGHHYWMALSPYPYGEAAFENPSILVSEDGLEWSVPEGLTNPLILPKHGTLSDATAVYDDASDELWVYYTADTKVNGTDLQSMYRLMSLDGIHWSAPELVLDGKSFPIQSPSVLAMGGTYTMWTVGAGAKGCTTAATIVNQRTSLDGVHWSAPQPVNVALPGQVIWHLNVIPLTEPGRFLAALTAFPDGATCSWTSLFLADSHGQSWKAYPTPLIAPSGGWDSEEIYRASLLYEPESNLLRVWYSARTVGANQWHIGYTEGPLAIEP